MKKLLILITVIIMVSSCFDPPDITPPTFIPKSPPDSLVEKGIDAHPDNAIYLEWEEPATAEDEGILSYYIYRGTKSEGEYKFKYIDDVVRNAGIINESDAYIDYSVDMDSTYYYYLRSHNDFTDSKETSDTVSYKLARKVVLRTPTGDIYNSAPSIYFEYSPYAIDRINYFYLRLDHLEAGSYENILFLKIHRFDLSKAVYGVYINNFDEHTTILRDEIMSDDDGKYLSNGYYRWRVDAVSGELGGAAESVGSESEWMYFVVN